LLESSIRFAEVGSPNHHAALEPRKRHAHARRFSFYRRCDPPARDRRRYRHQARQSQLASARPGLRPISRTAARSKGRDMCADRRPRYAFSASGLAAYHLVRASCHQCSHKAAIAHASLLQGRPGYTRLITLERSGARAALSHPCRDVVSGAGRAQIGSLIAMGQRQSPEIATFPCGSLFWRRPSASSTKTGLL
jgi:hypothetical protein